MHLQNMLPISLFVPQATPTALRLVCSSSLALLATWSPPSKNTITLGTATASTILLATAGKALFLIRCSTDATSNTGGDSDAANNTGGGRTTSGSLTVVTTRTLDHEIACVALRAPPAGIGIQQPPAGVEDMEVDLPPVSGGNTGGGELQPSLAAVGLWTAVTVSLLELPGLDTVGEPAPLGAPDVLPRSLAFFTAAAATRASSAAAAAGKIVNQ